MENLQLHMFKYIVNNIYHFFQKIICNSNICYVGLRIEVFVISKHFHV